MAAYIAGAAITLFAIGLFLYFRHKEKTVGRPGQEAASPKPAATAPKGQVCWPADAVKDACSPGSPRRKAAKILPDGKKKTANRVPKTDNPRRILYLQPGDIYL